MKTNLTRAIVFTALGIALLAIGELTKGIFAKNWADFALGACLPMFVGALIAIIKYFKDDRQPAQAN